MAHFIKKGTSFHVSNEYNLDIHPALPVGNYIIEQDPFGNMWLEEIDAFDMPGKLYGDVTKNAERVLNTYMDRPAGTGILLSGEKGSGKTLLGKQICNLAAEKGMPTIVINKPLCGDGFNSFLQEIQQPCVVMFDEFEKVYCAEAQEQVLTLLDGVFSSKKLFVFTCNEEHKIDSHMRNRPGRIFYALKFDGLESAFIREYAEDNLKDPSQAEGIVNVASLFWKFNFDMLKAIVEEMNRYNETPMEAVKFLNTTPDSSYGKYVCSSFTIGGVQQEKFAPREIYGNPLGQAEIGLQYYDPKGKDMDWEKGDKLGAWVYPTLKGNHLKSLDPIKGEYVYEMGNIRVVFTKNEEKHLGVMNAYAEYEFGI